MTRDDLIEIFKKYLNREPKKDEFVWHLDKNYLDLISEILTCDEYLSLPKNSVPCKIAILLSGHIRKNQIQNSLNLLKDYDFDIFIHTWDNFGFKGNETNLDDLTNIELIENTISKIPNVKKFEIENNKNFIKSLKNEDVKYFNYSSPEKFIKSQLYSISKSYKIFEDFYKSNNEKYDIVIRTRFENEFTQFMIDENLLHNIKNYNIIFVPNKDCGHHHPDSNSTTCQVCEKMFYEHNLKHVHSFDHSHVICDIFAYGSVDSMKKYCTLYEKYDSLNKGFESLNMDMLKTKNINYTIKENVYLMDMDLSGHLNSLYYINCSYPERLLQFQLKNYMLPSSSKIKINWKR